MCNKYFNFNQKFLSLLQMVSPYLASKKAFLMYCQHRAMPAPLRKLEIPTMADAKKEVLHLDGKKIMTYTWGHAGKPVLLVHGWGARAARFSLFVKALVKNGYQPIAFDAPGHGESTGCSTNIIECLKIMRRIQEKHKKFAAIIAHSVGVLYAFYAVKNGVSTNSIVAISGVSEFMHTTNNFSRIHKLNEQTYTHFKKRVEKAFEPTTDI
ncbi:MAG: alpha/beta hydrolase [Gammaproteobacteria bacterium]|nr:alpha/beta hydrolase [Gammaproteobacteria bacterium]